MTEMIKPMIEASIQVRRITDKVRKFYELFGFRHFTQYQNGRSVIKGSKRLGLDEIECVVSDTARGTSVGFYGINTLQALIYSVPFLSLLVLHILNRFDIFSGFISGGDSFLSINILKLFTGDADLNLTFIFSILIISLIPFLVEYTIQTIRVANIKARFSFYSKNAIWETREAPTSLVILQSIKSAFTQMYLLAIIFFAIFSFDTTTIAEVTKLYQTNEGDLLLATQKTFSITGGIILGLISGDKAIKLQKHTSTYDKRQRISGSILERRLEPILFGLQAAIYSSFVFGIFLSTTFFIGASFSLSIQLIIFAAFGGIIAGLIHQEDNIWFTSIYAAIIFFSAIVFIFRTGSNPEYAFLVILELFLIPIPFVIHYSKQFQKSLLREGIDSQDWLYEFIPLTSWYSIYKIKKRRVMTREAYEIELSKDLLPPEIEGRKIQLTKDLLQDRSSLAYRLARHYFELIISYTASFEEDVFVIIPTTSQLHQWWLKKSNGISDKSQIQMIEFIDQLLWNNSFSPTNDNISAHEMVGKEMVIAIQ